MVAAEITPVGVGVVVLLDRKVVVPIVVAVVVGVVVLADRGVVVPMVVAVVNSAFLVVLLLIVV